MHLRFINECQIEAAPEKVWQALTDFAGRPEAADVAGAAVASAPGRTPAVAKARLDAELEIVLNHPPHAFSARVHHAGMTGLSTYRLTALDQGARTQLEHEFETELGFIAGLIMRLVAGRAFHTDLLAVKHFTEERRDLAT